jgi:hypothetical protein
MDRPVWRLQDCAPAQTRGARRQAACSLDSPPIPHRHANHVCYPRRMARHRPLRPDRGPSNHDTPYRRNRADSARSDAVRGS